MIKIKNVFITTILTVISFCFLFSFSACGTTKTYEDFKKGYNSFLTTYEGNLFENGTFHVVYASTLQAYINEGTEQDGLRKLSSSLTDGQAVFEPTMRACFESVDFLLDAVKTSNVKSESVEKLLKTLSSMNEKFSILSKNKVQLEANSASKDDVLLLLFDYEKSFKEAIDVSSNFALEFLNLYENEILSTYENGSRISTKHTSFAIVKSVARSAFAYDKFVLSNIFDTTFVANQNICQKTLSSFLEVKHILKTDFNSITNSAQTNEEKDMIQNYELLDSFNPSFEDSLSSAKKAISKFSIKTLRHNEETNTLTKEQTICLTAVDTFLQSDLKILVGYFNNMVNSIITWNEEQGD